jgi:hypothetical protein
MCQKDDWKAHRKICSTAQSVVEDTRDRSSLDAKQTAEGEAVQRQADCFRAWQKSSELVEQLEKDVNEGYKGNNVTEKRKELEEARKKLTENERALALARETAAKLKAEAEQAAVPI